MSGKKIAIAALVTLAILGGIAVPAGMFLVLVAAVGAGSASAANPCQVGGVAAASGPVRLPVVGPYTVTSNFGMRLHPVLRTYQLHAGVDLVESSPGPVVAAAAGTVDEILTGYAGGRGNTVTVNVGGGVRTRYQHLASIAVTMGEQVSVGQQVGVEGNTGIGTGSHLHFETIINGQPQDPRIWLAQNGVQLPAKGAGGTAPPMGMLPSLVSAAPSGLNVPTTSATSNGIPTAIGTWHGEQLVNAGQVIKAGQSMGLDTWTITVGVMTAMGESSLTVLDRGDAVGPDSRGLFQQRANGAWGTYADRMNPATSATNFFKALIAVPGYRTMAPTIAAHNTQHNADPFHYARFWPDAAKVVAALTGDPNILASLPSSGTEVGCASDSTSSPAGTSTSPPAPQRPCPASPVLTGAPAPVQSVADCVRAAFPQATDLRYTSAGLVVMVPDYRTPQGREQGWRIAEWVRVNAATLHVAAVAFDAKTATGSGPWAPLVSDSAIVDDTLSLRDHIRMTTG